MKKIVVLSGKGGVGKSSITASLAVLLSEEKNIICADCDVDASNLALVLGARNSGEDENLSTNQKAVFDTARCISCKRCFDECYFDAISWANDKPQLKEFSCEGCGLCTIVCPKDAVSMIDVNNAKIGWSESRHGFKIIHAQLNPGESGSGKVVSQVKIRAEQMGKGSDIMLIDSAAGIGCPVIASVSGSDYALLVTEPTPSGFADMKKAQEIVGHFNIPSGIVINKYDLNDTITRDIIEYAKEKEIKVLGNVPFDKKFADALTRMAPIIESDKRYRELFSGLKDALIREVML